MERCVIYLKFKFNWTFLSLYSVFPKFGNTTDHYAEEKKTTLKKQGNLAFSLPTHSTSLPFLHLRVSGIFYCVENKWLQAVTT